MSKVLIGLAVTLLAISGCTYTPDQQPMNTQSNGYYYYYNDSSNLKDYSFNDYGIDVDVS